MIMAVVQLLLFVFRYLENRGKVNDARRAVEADLLRLVERIQRRTDIARDDVDTSPDSVRDDPNNRDNDGPS